MSNYKPKESLTIEGKLLWPKFTTEDQFKVGFHSFEVAALSDETVEAIEDLVSRHGVDQRQEPREKNLANIKKKLKKATDDEEKQKLELRLQEAIDAGMFISLKQRTTRIERRKESQNYNKIVNWPISVKREDGSYYTKEESELLMNGCLVRCAIDVFENDYGTFYSYQPSSLVILEEVAREPYEGDFHESELVDGEASTVTPDTQAPLTEVDPLDDEVPF